MNIVEFLVAASAIATILIWLGVTPRHVTSLFSQQSAANNSLPAPFKKWRLIVVGLLFGTSFAGFSYLYAHKPTETGMRITSQKAFPPSDPNWHFGLEVQIETELDRATPTEIFLICDGDIGDGHGKFLKTGEFSPQPASHQVIENHRDVIILKWGDPWKTDNPVVVQLFSKSPIHAQYVVPMIYRGNAPYM
jgi:hypothetical protein